MAQTIEFGVFTNGTPGYDRLDQAQATARRLGVTLNANGTRFAGVGNAGDPLKVTVNLPEGTRLTADVVAQGRDAFDGMLREGERLSDYALVKDNGTLTHVISLLTGAVQSVGAAPARVNAAMPTRSNRWSPFSRLGR